MEAAEFESLFIEHKDALYRQMIRVCNQKEDAEDALATAMLQAFKSAHQLQSHEAFRGWVATIGRRVCTRMRHHPAVQEAFAFAEEHDLIAPTGDEFELAVLKGCVREAVDTLPDLYRKVYDLCELNECTVPEAAEQLNLSVAAVKSRLLRARTMIREQLDSSVCA